MLTHLPVCRIFNLFPYSALMLDVDESRQTFDDGRVQWERGGSARSAAPEFILAGVTPTNPSCPRSLQARGRAII